MSYKAILEFLKKCHFCESAQQMTYWKKQSRKKENESKTKRNKNKASEKISLLHSCVQNNHAQTKIHHRTHDRDRKKTKD